MFHSKSKSWGVEIGLLQRQVYLSRELTLEVYFQVYLRWYGMAGKVLCRG